MVLETVDKSKGMLKIGSVRESVFEVSAASYVLVITRGNPTATRIGHITHLSHNAHSGERTSLLENTRRKLTPRVQGLCGAPDFLGLFEQLHQIAALATSLAAFSSSTCFAR